MSNSPSSLNIPCAFSPSSLLGSSNLSQTKATKVIAQWNLNKSYLYFDQISQTVKLTPDISKADVISIAQNLNSSDYPKNVDIYDLFIQNRALTLNITGGILDQGFELCSPLCKDGLPLVLRDPALKLTNDTINFISIFCKDDCSSNTFTGALYSANCMRGFVSRNGVDVILSEDPNDADLIQWTFIVQDSDLDDNGAERRLYIFMAVMFVFLLLLCVLAYFLSK